MQEDELRYKPDAGVVRTARSFIRSLCETYGHSQGMQVWDRIRETLGDRAASDIFLGMLTGDYHSVKVTRIGQLKIEAIKEVRHFTGWGLKEAKDFVEDVQSIGPREITSSMIREDRIQDFATAMRRIGCTVE
jgi:ribosomal protein L7/L12